jgi:hypothetical protein
LISRLILRCLRAPPQRCYGAMQLCLSAPLPTLLRPLSVGIGTFLSKHRSGRHGRDAGAGANLTGLRHLITTFSSLETFQPSNTSLYFPRPTCGKFPRKKRQHCDCSQLQHTFVPRSPRARGTRDESKNCSGRERKESGMRAELSRTTTEAVRGHDVQISGEQGSGNGRHCLGRDRNCARQEHGAKRGGAF